MALRKTIKIFKPVKRAEIERVMLSINNSKKELEQIRIDIKKGNSEIKENIKNLKGINVSIEYYTKNLSRVKASLDKEALSLTELRTNATAEEKEIVKLGKSYHKEIQSIIKEDIRVRNELLVDKDKLDKINEAFSLAEDKFVKRECEIAQREIELVQKIIEGNEGCERSENFIKDAYVELSEKENLIEDKNKILLSKQAEIEKVDHNLGLLNVSEEKANNRVLALESEIDINEIDLNNLRKEYKTLDERRLAFYAKETKIKDKETQLVKFYKKAGVDIKM